MMVSNNHAMARLHALFWGKAMDQDSNGSSSKGEEYNEQLEDDVVPGCPAFELEETGKVRNFLIRVSVFTMCMNTVFKFTTGRLNTNASMIFSSNTMRKPGVRLWQGHQQLL